MTSISTRLISSLFVITTACATEPSEDEACANCSDGKADGTNPTSGTGTLTITVPPGAGPATLLARLTTGSLTIPFEPGVQRVVADGTYCVWSKASNESSSSETKADCQVTVGAGQARTYDMGTVTLVHGRDELVWGIDIAPPKGWLSSRTDAVPHAVGDYSYTVGNQAYDQQHSLTLSVAAGENTNADVTDAQGQRAIRLIPSTGRTLPDAGNVPGVRLCLGSYDGCVPYFVPSKPVLVIFTPSPNIWLRFEWLTGASGFWPVPGMLDVQLRRLDLNHVRVTLANGTVQDVVGRVRVEANQTILRDLATGQGLDLPPASYKVHTSFIHPANGDEVVLTEVVDLR